MEMTPEQRQRLTLERANTRRRMNALRISAKALATWLDPFLAADDKRRAQSADRWLARLGEDNVRKLALRMRRMAPWEQARRENA